MPDAPFYRKSLLATLVLLAGCGKSPKDKLAGKWVGDRIDNVSADQVASATGWVKMTTFEFAGDSITVTIPSEPPRKGTYKVSRVDGDTLVLAFARVVPRQQTAFFGGSYSISPPLAPFRLGAVNIESGAATSVSGIAYTSEIGQYIAT